MVLPACICCVSWFPVGDHGTAYLCVVAVAGIPWMALHQALKFHGYGIVLAILFDLTYIHCSACDRYRHVLTSPSLLVSHLTELGILCVR